LPDDKPVELRVRGEADGIHAAGAAFGQQAILAQVGRQGHLGGHGDTAATIEITTTLL
jgi:hypothetical protein